MQVLSKEPVHARWMLRSGSEMMPKFLRPRSNLSPPGFLYRALLALRQLGSFAVRFPQKLSCTNESAVCKRAVIPHPQAFWVCEDQNSPRQKASLLQSCSRATRLAPLGGQFQHQGSALRARYGACDHPRCEFRALQSRMEHDKTYSRPLLLTCCASAPWLC